MATTLKDMARILNVTSSTVSRVLSKNTGASEETKKRITELAKMLNYRPNPVAQALVLKQTRIINIIIPQTSEFVFSNPFYSQILSGVGIAARQRKYYLNISLFQEMNIQTLDVFPIASGVLVLSNRLGDENILREKFRGIPTVTIPGFLRKTDFSTADFDNLNGAKDVIDYLFSLGHQRIAFISGPKGAKHSMVREKGFREAFQKNKLFLDDSLVVEGDFTEASGVRGIEKLIGVSPPPTAVVCVNDVTAVGALWAAKRAGLNVPRDLSIVGFGDIPLVALLAPALTTIREPFVELGGKAINLLIDLIEGKKSQREDIVVSVELVVRESTAPPKL